MARPSAGSWGCPHPHSFHKQQDRILTRIGRLSGEPPLSFGKISQIHGANDDIQPTVLMQITRIQHSPLITGGYGKGVWFEFVETDVLQIDDAPLGMSLIIGEIAGHQNVESTVLGEIGHDRLAGSIHGEEVAFVKVVLAVILQDPHSMVGLDHTEIVEVVYVHIEDIQLAVALE